VQSIHGLRSRNLLCQDVLQALTPLTAVSDRAPTNWLRSWRSNVNGELHQLAPPTVGMLVGLHDPGKQRASSGKLASWMKKLTIVVVVSVDFAVPRADRSK